MNAPQIDRAFYRLFARSFGINGVQRQVQFQDIDARDTEHAKVRRVRILRDEIAHLFRRQIARLGHTRHLKFGVVEADVRVESAGGSGDGISGNWRVRGQPVLGTVIRDVLRDGIAQLLGGRARLLPPELVGS